MCSDRSVFPKGSFVFSFFSEAQTMPSHVSLPWADWLAGQLQSLSIAGSSNPRSWQALRSLLLLETGWTPATYSEFTEAVCRWWGPSFPFFLITKQHSYPMTSHKCIWFCVFPQFLPSAASNSLHPSAVTLRPHAKGSEGDFNSRFVNAHSVLDDNVHLSYKLAPFSTFHSACFYICHVELYGENTLNNKTMLWNDN